MRHPTSLAFLLLAVLLLAGCGTPSRATRSPSPPAPIPPFSVYGASSADGSVTALNASTGMQRWKVHPAGKGGIRLVAVNNSVLYLTVNAFNSSPPSFHLVAVNAGNGSLRWSFQRKGVDGEVLALDNGILYGFFGNQANGPKSLNDFFALKADTGKVLWDTPIQVLWDAHMQDFGWVAGMLANGILYGFLNQGSSDPTLSNEVLALNADTGTMLWELPTQFAGSIESILANGMLYVDSIYGGQSPPGPAYLYGLDATTGAVQWRQVRQEGTTDLKAVSGDTLYVAESYPEGPAPANLVALDAHTGAERWQQTADYIGINNTSVVAEVDQGDVSPVSVFFTALRGSNGSAIWRVQVTPFSTLVLDGGVLYAASDANMVAAFSVTDGSLLWQSSPVPGQATNIMLTVANGTLYAALEHVGLFAFHAPDGKLLWQYMPGATIIAVQNGVLYGQTSSALVALDANTGTVYWQATSEFDSVVLG